MSRVELRALARLIDKVIAQDWPAGWDLRRVAHEGYDPMGPRLTEEELGALDTFIAARIDP